MNLVRPCIFLILFASFSPPAAAATLQGTVRDSSGAVVASAEVAVSYAATSDTSVTKTDSQEHFSVDGLPAGEYQITIKQPGFENAQRAVTIGKEPNASIDIQLKIQVQETVLEVTARRSTLANSRRRARAK